MFSGHARGLGGLEVVGGGVLGSVKGVHGCVGCLHLEQIGGDLKLLIFLRVISEKVPMVLLTLKMSTVKSGSWRRSSRLGSSSQAPAPGMVPGTWYGRMVSSGRCSSGKGGAGSAGKMRHIYQEPAPNCFQEDAVSRGH